MHITLIDDSIPFDGYTASNRPLGGAEKAFASLPGALARLGHEVHVINRCQWAMYVEGANWETMDGKRPLRTDVLIAYRKPSLLEAVRHAAKRVLWWTGPARGLDTKQMGETLSSHAATVLLMAQAQVPNARPKGVTFGGMPAAVRNEFLVDGGEARPTAPRAIVTTHPSHGLSHLLDLWVERIRPQSPQAELHVVSLSLARAADGSDPDPALAEVTAKALDARAHGVVIVRPQSDPGMARFYRQARVHLYPGHTDDMGSWTLMESQACGVPAVVRPLGAAPERLVDGRTGYVAPDDDAFVNLGVMLLNSPETAAGMGADARALYQGRSWDAAAKHVEGLLA
jgi:glycosyltransferase involved in cell wall biosynthesis